MDLDQLGTWYPLLEAEFQKPYFRQLQSRVEEAYAINNPRIFPPEKDLFRAFELTPPEAVKAVILGQDPYHGQHQAHGLSFSVQPGVSLPRSLKNIFKELQDDLGCIPPNHGCLQHWAQEGVLLLNTTLTVYEGQPDSHSKWGWQSFTQAVLEQTRQLSQPIAFILWGSKAQATAEAAKVQESTYPRLCLTSAHPSPLGAYRGFWGSKPFSQVNAFLVTNNSYPINWQISNR